MNKKEKKRRIGLRFLLASLICAVLLILSGLWLFLIPLLPILLGLGIRLHLLSKRNIQPDMTSADSDEDDAPTAPMDNIDTFGRIQLRITELVREQFPNARWVWENPNARFAIDNYEPLFIRLNRAGGFRRAKVILYGDEVAEVNFCVTTSPVESDDTAPEDDSKDKNADADTEDEDSDSEGSDTEDEDVNEDNEDSLPPPKENYELMAFEWVDANILWLNDQMNEAIAQNSSILLVSSEYLPASPCWPALCKELAQSQNLKAFISENGIKVELSTQ